MFSRLYVCSFLIIRLLLVLLLDLLLPFPSFLSLSSFSFLSSSSCFLFRAMHLLFLFLLRTRFSLASYLLISLFFPPLPPSPPCPAPAAPSIPYFCSIVFILLPISIPLELLLLVLLFLLTSVLFLPTLLSPPCPIPCPFLLFLPSLFSL